MDDHFDLDTDDPLAAGAVPGAADGLITFAQSHELAADLADQVVDTGVQGAHETIALLASAAQPQGAQHVAFLMMMLPDYWEEPTLRPEVEELVTWKA